MIDHIIDNIYIGNHSDAKKLNILHDNNIKSIINCVEEILCYYQDKFYYLHLFLQPQQIITKHLLFNVVKFININEECDSNVLVHCHEGKERAPSIIILYLMYNNKMDYQSAYELVKMKRTETDILISDMLKNKIIKLIKN